MKNSDIIFWSTMFFTISTLLYLALGIKRMIIVWFVILLGFLVIEITFQYYKLLQRVFD